MRTYLVVIDETEESGIALRFAARRAAKTGGTVAVLSLIPVIEFVQWGGVQATIEEEARAKAEALVSAAASTLIEESGVRPSITVRQGEGPKIVRDMLDENHDIVALVLGAAASGAPGPLVSHFVGHDAGKLRCPIMIIPGSISIEELDRLS